MTNVYSVVQFAITLSELDLLVNSEDKNKREEIANEVRKNELN